MWWCVQLIFVTLLPGIFTIPINKETNITVDEIIYELYSKTNPDGYRLIPFNESSLEESGFNPNQPLKIIIHGFMDDNGNSVFTLPKKAFLGLTEDVNLVGLDWSACSKVLLYEEAVQCARVVGEETGLVLQWLINVTGLSRDNIHLIGHSLGAQVTSFVHKYVTPGRITALDPAAPLFNHVGPDERIDPTDADFVDVIHTSIVFFGLPTPVGHIDFYPNGGSEQPGCSDVLGGCAHSVAYHFYAYTIYEANRNAYMAYSCPDVDNARNGTCSGLPQVPMGYSTPNDARGIYFVDIPTVP